jgi:filamentous hemagglutinin family protein
VNKIYRVIWSHALHSFVAVSELARSIGPKAMGGGSRDGSRPASRKNLRPLALATLLAFSPWTHAADLPTGGQIVAGAGSIAQSDRTLTVTQNSANLVVNWQSFSIGRDSTVRFVQPSASAVALNRVLGSDVSVIQGALTANGQVFLVNPNGVLFTPTARVEAAGIVASTLQLSTEDFLAGNYTFEGDSRASVVNLGRIEASRGGSIALVAARIVNDGILHAQAGQVLLGAGRKVTLDLGGPVKLEVEQGALDALISNGGAIRADGGTVLLTARAAQDLAATVINHTGVIEAQSLGAGHDGTVVLLGEQGTVQVTGAVDVSSPTGKGGKAVVTGTRVLVGDGALVDARGATGGGEIYVGGSWQGQDPAIRQANATVIGAGAVLDASATARGDGGTIVAWSDIHRADGVTRAYGSLLARGGAQGGNGGRIETSGHDLDVGRAPDMGAAAGNGGLWLLDPYNIIIDSNPGNAGIGASSPFVSGGNDAHLGLDVIDAALQVGDVTIQTGAGGTQAGNIYWQSAYNYSGAATRKLTLDAHRSIFLDGTISSTGGALSMNLNANGDGKGLGYVAVRGDLLTNGGDLRFRGVGARFDGTGAQTLSTQGGAVHFYGEVGLANATGLSINTMGGDVDFDSLVDSTTGYLFDSSPIDWWSASASPNLATASSALENAAISEVAGGASVWLGGGDRTGSGQWRWVTGPLAAEVGGLGRLFHASAQTGQTGYNGADNQFVNWQAGQPGTAAGARGLLLDSSTGLWSAQDAGLLHGSVLRVLGADAPLAVNAGSGRVTFGHKVGSINPLRSLDVTAGLTVINGDSVRTQLEQTYNGDVEFGALTQFANPSFEDGLVGWSITNGRIRLNGVDNIGGYATPVDLTYPASVVPGCNVATGADCDTTTLQGGFTYTTNISADVAPGSGTKSLVMNSSGTCDVGFCIVRGPYVVSDSTVTLPVGGMVSFKWQAKGGGDAYDVFGYLLNVHTGAVQPILNATGASASSTQPWTTALVNLTEPGTYKFVFVSGSWDATGGRVLGAQLFIDDIKAAGGLKLVDASKVTFNGQVRAVDNQLTIRADKMDFAGNVSGTNRLTLEQRSDTQKVELGGSANGAADTLDLTADKLARLQDGFLSITVGSDTGTAGVKVLGPTTFLDNAIVRGGTAGIDIQDSLTTTAGNTLTLNTRGTVTQTASGVITTNALELLGAAGVHRLGAASNQVATLAANTGSVTFSNAGALGIGSVNATVGVTTTGDVDIATESGNLTLNQSVSSGATGTDAVVLNAGRAADAGSAAGGNVIVAAGKTVSTGLGGRATIYTGSVAGSTGLNGLVGNASGRFRYGSDEEYANYSMALGTGAHAIYREAPTVGYTTFAQTKVYDGSGYNMGVGISGLLNGDTNPLVSASSGKDVGTYAVQLADFDTGLGYDYSYSGSTVTITPRPVTITAAAKTKVYGEADPSLTYTPSPLAGNTGLIPGDVFIGGLARNPGTDVGGYSITQGSLANPNYAISYVGNVLTITPRPLNVVADAQSKTYGDVAALTYVAEAQSAGRGLVAGDTLAGALAQGNENVGTHVIGQGTLANGNYTISYTGANMTIAQRAITLAADAVSRIYGETDPSLSVRIVSGSLGSASVSDTLSEVTGTLSREAGSNVGSYDVALGTGSKAGNYAITFNADNDALTITPRPVTVLADAKTKSQGTQDPELTYTVRPASPGQGLVSGESLSGSLEAVPIEGGRRKLITQGSLTQANNPNYAISFTDSVLTVEPANDALRAGQNSAHALAMSSGMGGLSGTNAGLAGASWGSTAAVSAADQGANTSPAGELVIVDVAGSALASGGDFSLAGAAGQPGMASDDDASDDADARRSRKPLASLTVFAVDGGIRLPVFAASPHAQPLEESKN